MDGVEPKTVTDTGADLPPPTRWLLERMAKSRVTRMFPPHSASCVGKLKRKNYIMFDPGARGWVVTPAGYNALGN